MKQEILPNGMIRITYDDGSAWDYLAGVDPYKESMSHNLTLQSARLEWIDLSSPTKHDKTYAWETKPKKRKKMPDLVQKIVGNVIIGGLKKLK